MKRKRCRPIHFSTIDLYDGTVLAAYPIRKPHLKMLKRDGIRIDPDGVADGGSQDGRHLGNPRHDDRTRFQDIIATRLNTRRAIRELVLPPMAKMQDDIDALRAEVTRLADLLAKANLTSKR